MADSSYDVQSTVGPVWPVRPARPVRREEKGSGRDDAPPEPTDAAARKRAQARAEPASESARASPDGVDADDPDATKGRRIDAYA